MFQVNKKTQRRSFSFDLGTTMKIGHERSRRDAGLLDTVGRIVHERPRKEEDEEEEEEEIRVRRREAMMMTMGSRPPTCESKCNACRPCEAVQVPTNLASTRGNAEQRLAIGKSVTSKSSVALPMSGSDPRAAHRNGRRPEMPHVSASSYSSSSDYKPEGWKCTCGNRLYNP